MVLLCFIVPDWWHIVRHEFLLFVLFHSFAIVDLLVEVNFQDSDGHTNLISNYRNEQKYHSRNNMLELRNGKPHFCQIFNISCIICVNESVCYCCISISFRNHWSFARGHLGILRRRIFDFGTCIAAVIVLQLFM